MTPEEFGNRIEKHKKDKQNEKYIANQMIVWLSVSIVITFVGLVFIPSIWSDLYRGILPSNVWYMLDDGGYQTDNLENHTIFYWVISWALQLSIWAEELLRSLPPVYLFFIPSMSVLFYKAMKASYYKSAGIKKPSLGILGLVSRVIFYSVISYFLFMNLMNVSLKYFYIYFLM